MALPSVDEIVKTLDQQRPADLGRGASRLFNKHGINVLIPGLIAALPRIKNWIGRNAILFELIRYARKKPEIVECAMAFINDSAYMVRMQACAILAYSLRKDCVPHLKALLKHKDSKTRYDAIAALDAIKHEDHHYFLDRTHFGTLWVLNPRRPRR